MSSVIAELIRKNFVTREQLSDMREKRLNAKEPLQNMLIEMGCFKEDDLFEAARRVSSVPPIDLDETTVDPHLLSLIPFEKARYHGIFPVLKEKDMLVLAMSDPSDIMAWDDIRFMTELTIKPLLCKRSQIEKYTSKYYKTEDTVQEILKDTIDDAQVELIVKDNLSREAIVDLAKQKADNSSFVKLLNKIIIDAVEGRASDIHVEPQEKVVDVRYRVDGYLKSIIRIPRDFHPRLAARIKILARLDIAEQGKVQEGRIKVLINGKKIDLRISIIPVFYGEKIVLRILDSRGAEFDLNKIGFERKELAIFKESIKKPQGMILVTGPTGSGKTTTLYSALQHIKSESKNIVTIEDPIEYLIEGINQLQLSRFKDITFANGLRSILRQDPDAILVGEIRDKETAEIAFRASLTGHLVFSTLHTNNSASSVTRLLNIGLEAYMISSSILMFAAQRLVRLICRNCSEEHLPDEKLLFKFRNYLRKSKVKKYYTGRGCARCNFTGYYGRTSIFEILKVDEKIRTLIFNRAPESDIHKAAVANGMKTLLESGLMKVAAGLTTLEELSKVADVADSAEEKEASFSFA